MHRKLISILFLVSFVALSFNRAVIVLSYYSNPSTYAQNCENLDRPQLKCKGKCQMMKKIKDEEKKEQQNPDRKIENKNEVNSSISFFTCQISPPGKISIFKSSNINYSIPQGINTSVFHPPAMC